VIKAISVYQESLQDVSTCLETVDGSLDNRLNALNRWNCKTAVYSADSSD
jgi:flagellin-like hook-associated protein FlgL